MEVSHTTSSLLFAVAAKQLQTMSEVQMAVLKHMAESQRQIAEYVHSIGIGQNIDVTA